MQLSKKLRFSPVLLLLFLCYAVFSKVSYAQLSSFQDPCGGGGGLFSATTTSSFGGGVALPIGFGCPPDAPTLAPTTTQNSFPVNTNFVLTMPQVAPIDIGSTNITYYEMHESRNNSKFTRIANVNVLNGFTVTRQLATAGAAYYKYRVCIIMGVVLLAPQKQSLSQAALAVVVQVVMMALTH